MIDTSLWLWLAFHGFILGMLALDLGVLHRKAHEVEPGEAIIWSCVWIGSALIFNVGIYVWVGSSAALDFLTGFLLEKSLSIDNIFVFILIFGAFSIPLKYQHRVLFWGVLGALVMRAAMIAVGISLIEKFHWVIYVFGLFLIYTAYKTARHPLDAQEISNNPLLARLRKILPMTKELQGQRFFVRQNLVLMATPLFLTLIFIEFADLLFAVDSIPAILAITTDPFIVYTSNVFAILGLRSLYFLIAALMPRFYYILYALILILGFVGVKMLLTDLFHIASLASFCTILFILIGSILASIRRAQSE